MATKSKSRGRGSSRGKGSSRSRSHARKPAAKRSARTPVRQHLAPWARDAVGIGLVVLGLLAVLALWFDAAGAVGRGIDVASHGMAGVAALVLPLVGVYWGYKAYQGEMVEIPVISNLVRNQGWA